MPKSHNGWVADRDPSKINVVAVDVPKMDLTIRVRKETAPIFLAVIADFDANVDRVEGKILDDWSFAYRPIRGYENDPTVPLSNHSSGTAIDLNATKYPITRRNMTDAQRKACRAIVKRFRGVIAWGGDFSRPDEMHFEIASGVTVAEVKQVVKDLGLNPDGTTIPPAIFKKELTLGDTGAQVKTVQRALRLHVDGVYGAATKKAVRAFQIKRPWLGTPNGVCREKTYAALVKRLG